MRFHEDVANWSTSDLGRIPALCGPLVAVALAVALAGCSATSPFDRGLALFRAGQYEQARQAFDDAVRRAPGWPEAYTNRGVTRARLGDLDGAIRDYTQALELAPDDADTLLNRGNAYVGKRDYQRAIADFTRALKVHPRYVRALFNRGTARSLAGDPEGARADWREAAELEPDPREKAAMRQRAGLESAAPPPPRVVSTPAPPPLEPPTPPPPAPVTPPPPVGATPRSAPTPPPATALPAPPSAVAPPPPAPTTAPAAGATAENKEDGPPPVSEERLARLMEEASRAMTGGDFRQAVEYYTKILEYPRHRFSQEAQEFLGLARERNGQLAHARAEYEQYLRLYPEGEGADRVRQRLAGLLTARATPKEKLREARAPRTETDIHGSFSQYYHRFENFPDQGGNVVTRSLLSTDLDLAFRRRTGGWEVSSILNGGYDYDFLDEDHSNLRLSRLYLDVLDRHDGISARVGRQTRSTDGVLGRFDGAVLGYQLFRPIKVNGLFGFPADQSLLKDYETDKYFYGLSLDLGTFGERWNFNLYGIRQEAEGILDRQAVGAEVRYVDASRSLFSLVDYDISYNELNTVLAVANWIFPDRTIFNVAFDQRKSPILTTSNALIGQPVDSLSVLRRTLSEDEVRDLGRDRTAISRSLTLGMTRPFNEQLQVSGDFTVSETTGTRASGGVEAFPGTGYEYFYSAQLIGSSLVTAGDLAILGLRYSNTSTVDTIGLNLNTRYPVNREWRINPKIQVDYRQRHREDTDEVKLRPSLTMDYYLMRRIRLEVEGGVDWTPKWLSNDTETMDFFLTVGYRIDF